MAAQLAFGGARASSAIERPKADFAAASISLSPDLHLTSRFDPILGETRVTGLVGRDLCVMLTLPFAWETADDPTAGLRATKSGAELALSVRSLDEAPKRSDPDLARSDALLLQREYEDLIGRPAQSVVLAPLQSGVTRWTATWIDANLSNAAHALTTEAILVELPRNRVLELSLGNAGTREAYEDLVHDALSRLAVSSAEQCGHNGW
jgi:hypothetical protein